MRKVFIGLIILTIAHHPGFSQTDDDIRQYIRTYAKWAVREMHYSGIPASITLGQALIESGYGKSELATVANNHFGIKCQMEWSGPRYYYDDDERHDCFRAYQSVEQSYRDHSHFLMYRERYKGLFSLDPKDYKAWSHGLKKAGYATNPRYAYMLIDVIERYKLNQLDDWLPVVEPINSTAEVVLATDDPVMVAQPETRFFVRNRIDFIMAGEGDSVEKLTRELGKLRGEIRKYNELSKDDELSPGQIVYLQPKRRQAEEGFSTHVLQPGETMYDVSQHYGIKLRWLYKRNHLKAGSQPETGTVLWLRGYKK